MPVSGQRFPVNQTQSGTIFKKQHPSVPPLLGEQWGDQRNKNGTGTNWIKITQKRSKVRVWLAKKTVQKKLVLMPARKSHFLQPNKCPRFLTCNWCLGTRTGICVGFYFGAGSTSAQPRIVKITTKTMLQTVLQIWAAWVLGLPAAQIWLQEK